MVINPFNPQVPARPDFFVGREPEIIEFEKFLNQTIGGSPMNMSITGNRGIGKTSVLVKFEQIAKQNGCLVVRLSNYEGNVSSIIDFADFLITNIKTEIISKQPIEKLKDWIISLKPQIEWNDFTLSIEKKQIIQELLRQRLNKLWGETKDHYKAIVILIDEAESLEKIQGLLPFLREVFQRISSDSKYMVVLAGKLNFQERMSEEFSPLNRFFPAHKLNHFKFDEIKDYAERKLNAVRVKIEDGAVRLIYEASEGHPYVLVSVLFCIFDSLSENEKTITKAIVNRAMPRIRFELEKDFFSPMFHPLTPKAKEVLFSIVKKLGKVNFAFSDAVKWVDMERSYLSPYIKEMLRKGILNKPERGRYELFHKLFLEYVQNMVKKG